MAVAVQVLRRLAAGVVLTALAALAAASCARAQAVVVVVNGEPVTNFDIEQRTRLISIATHKPPSRQHVVEELITERLKLQLLKRFAIDGIDKDVENAFANMARRMRTTPKQFADNLEKQGIRPETLKSRMKADLVWNQIVRGRYQSAFQFTDKQVQARLEAKKPEDAGLLGYDYTLRPILLVVPRGSPSSATEARMKEAEALRARFETCERGLAMARAIGSVAVRASIIKSSAELPAPLREVLAKTALGHLTPPEVTTEGVQLYAVCSRKESDTSPAQSEIRNQMYHEAFEAQSKKLLKELRSQAMIEYR
jgi:peptidyl-prolyl cis-trans isomerase SurA